MVIDKNTKCLGIDGGRSVYVLMGVSESSFLTASVFSEK